LADVDRDVLGAEEEELGLVVRVDQDEVPGVLALAVAGLAEHLAGGAGELALVGHGDTEHVGHVRRSSAGGHCFGVRTSAARPITGPGARRAPRRTRDRPTDACRRPPGAARAPA